MTPKQRYDDRKKRRAELEENELKLREERYHRQKRLHENEEEAEKMIIGVGRDLTRIASAMEKIANVAELWADQQDAS